MSKETQGVVSTPRPQEQLPVIITEAQAKIAEFKQLVTGLIIVDADGLSSAKNHLATLVKFRTSHDKRREELIRPALDWQKKVNAEFKTIEAEVKPLENTLQETINKFEHAERERKRALERKRIAKLELYGMSLIGMNWSIGNYHVHAPSILSMNEEQFESVLINAAKERADIGERERQARLAKEEAERVQAELEAKRKELAELEAKLKQASEPKPEAVEVVAPMADPTHIVTTVETITIDTSTGEILPDAPFDLPESKPVVDTFKLAFQNGVDHCREQVIKILNDRSITSRAVMIERINQIK